MIASKKYIFALATFTGTIIGAGFFGLPYVASRAGWFTMLIYFLVIGFVIIAASLLYGQVVTGTKGLHRLPGYAEIYLGKKWKHFVFLTTVLGLFGTLLCYIILGGNFLHGLFSSYLGGPLIIYVLVYFALGAYFVFRDARTIARVEVIMLVLFVLMILLFSVSGYIHINAENFKLMSKNIFLPFGVVMFSLWGLSIVPELKEILGDEERKLKKVLISGVVLSAMVYLIFIYLVWGISGEGTSEDAISGLKSVFGEKIILFGYIFGFLATFTSFITLGLVTKKIFNYDYKIPKNFAWFFALFIPLSLYLLGLKNFISILGITGAFMFAVNGIIILAICIRAKGHITGRAAYSMSVPTFLKYVFILILITGVVFELITLFKG